MITPLKDEDVSVHETKIEVGKGCCPLCEVDMTNTKALQQSDKHRIRIAKMLEDPRSRFHERDSYWHDNTGLLYDINRENGKEYRATAIPKTLIETVLQGMSFWYWENLFPDQAILLLAQNDKIHAGPCRQLFLVLKGKMQADKGIW